MVLWFTVVALAAAALTAAARHYALRRRLYDEPGERRSHSVATPRGGGLGPVLAIALFIAFMAFDGAPGARWSLLLAGLLAVAGIGWWDDHRPLPAPVRLLVHLVAGALLAAAFGLWNQPLIALAAVLATAVLVNVWNFMDGINGIAATQAAIVALVAAAVLPAGAAWMAVAVLAACLGFLPFNFPRARIFLGDVGSGGLGFAVAALLVAGAYAEVADGLLLLMPASAFLVDAGLTLGMRMLQRERWWAPHTRHLYQAWARAAGHPRVTLAYASWSGAGLVAAVLIEGAPLAVIILFTAGWYTATVGAWSLLRAAMYRKDSAA